ncbi:hypothetical protein [Rossellomorea sp. BNER]|uniref:hypothetical protein n=1 Tax=Rossellomorea sp. BNER TaxID=2962031 RepID=UPI003AF270BB
MFISNGKHYESRGRIVPEKVYVRDFNKANDSLTIQSAIDFAKNNNVKTVMLDDRDYVITSPIVIKQGVKLLFGYGTQFIVEGNFRVIELQKNASIEGAYIAINDSNFDSEVIYLDGKYKYYNTWHRTQVKDINIVNWFGSHKGIGLSLYSGGAGHEITFIDFENIKVAGLKTGLKLVVNRPSSGLAWINANRFINLSLDDCVDMITLDSHSTIPNEISGNQFRNIQVQPSSQTNKILKVSGQFNEFDGMVWETHVIPHDNPVIELTDQSMDTTLYIPSVPDNRILDRGHRNKINL